MQNAAFYRLIRIHLYISDNNSHICTYTVTPKRATSARDVSFAKPVETFPIASSPQLSYCNNIIVICRCAKSLQMISIDQFGPKAIKIIIVNYLSNTNDAKLLTFNYTYFQITQSILYISIQQYARICAQCNE